MPKGGPDPYRVLGSSALASDLHAVTFNGTHVFQEGETVLVPRTRGGFTYGQVDRIYPKRIQCHLDKAVSHSILEYQVVVEEYPEVIVKGLPAAYIGKLKLSESPYDEDDDSEDRIVGGSPLVTDLRNMVFGSSKTGIPPGEIVLVPRSKGGFTYGMVSKQLNLTCSLSDQPRHSVPGIRVLLEDESASDNPLHKDLLFIFLGRLSFGQITTSSSKGGLPLPSPKHHPGVALMSTKLPLSSSTGKKGAASTSSNSEMCGECEEEKAVFECQNCDEFYCEACCGDVHSKGKRKLHKDIVRLEEQHSQPSTPHQLPTSSITSSSFNNATQLSQPALKGSGRGVKASPAKVAAKQQKQPKPAPKAPPVGTSVLAAKLMAPDEDSEEEESEEEEEEDEEEIKPVAKAPFQIKAPPMKNVPPLAAPPFKAPPSSSKPPPPTALAKKAALAQEEEEEEESEEESEEEEEEETPQAPVPSLMKSVVLPRPLPKVGPQPSMADAVTLKRPPPIKKAGPPSSTPTSTLPLVKKASPPPPPPSLPPPSSPSPPPPPPKEEEEEEKSEEEEESEEEEPVKAVPSKSLPAPSKITAPGGVKTPAPKFAPPKTASKQVIPFKPSSSISSLLPTPAPTPKPTPPPAQTQAPSFKPVVPAGLDPNDWETDSEEEEEEEEKSTEEGGGGNSFSSSTFSKNSFPRPSNAASVPDVLGSVLKIDYNGKVVSLKHDGSDSFTALLKNVTDTFGLSKDTKLNVKYKDDEGDLVTMSSDREFGHAKQLVDDIYIIIAPGS